MDIRELNGKFKRYDKKTEKIRKELAEYEKKYSGVDVDELHMMNNFLKSKLELCRRKIYSFIKLTETNQANEVLNSDIIHDLETYLDENSLKMENSMNLEEVLSKTLLAKQHHSKVK